MSKAASYALGLGIAVVVIISAARVDAAMVNGSYTSRNGTPLSGHQLHFENRISGDIYLVRTGTDGSFSAQLPPGIYDLRAKRGLVLASRVIVGGADVSIGHVSEGAPLDVRKPFEREGLGPALVQTGAPATAHLTGGETAATSPSPTPSPAAAAGAPATGASSAAANPAP